MDGGGHQALDRLQSGRQVRLLVGRSGQAQVMMLRCHQTGVRQEPAQQTQTGRLRLATRTAGQVRAAPRLGAAVWVELQLTLIDQRQAASLVVQRGPGVEEPGAVGRGCLVGIDAGQRA